DYNKTIDEAVNFLSKNDNTDINKYLKKMMIEASENLDFDKAVIYRDKLMAIDKIKESQKVIQKEKVDQDVVGFSFREDIAVVNVLKFRNGILCDKEESFFNDVSDINSVRNDFLSMYYIDNGDIPSIVMLDDDFEDMKILCDAIKGKHNKKVEFMVPKKGDNFKVVMMAIKNSVDKLDILLNNNDKNVQVKVLTELKNILNLDNLPKRIESYDISNLGSDDIVGTMIVFKDGRPLKSHYRKFKIKDQLEQDDYKSMAQVIERRFTRLLNKGDDKSFSSTPDIILLDGGKGHVSTVKNVLNKMGVYIPVFGMVKDNKHKTDAITKDGKKVEIKSNNNIFKFITEIQNEVHRFSIAYQRDLSKKRNINLTLCNVYGIGEKKANILLQHFKGVENIKKAKEEDFNDIKILTKKDINNIINYFKNDK
ncbi:MAG: excinuclease ABC subunit UvrC, partial [Oscillospiraceae bacterium]